MKRAIVYFLVGWTLLCIAVTMATYGQRDATDVVLNAMLGTVTAIVSAFVLVAIALAIAVFVPEGSAARGGRMESDAV